MSKFSKQNNSGFTLVETLVAISIFTVSILGMMAVLSGSISNTNYAKQKLTANYLAQEGIEYIRNIRDTYVLYSGSAQNGWNLFKSKLTGTSRCDLEDGCYVGDLITGDYTDETYPMAGISLPPCNGTCPEIKYNASNGKYNYASGVNSGFMRKIWIEPSADEVKIFSEVSWEQGSGDYSVTFSETLFNWIQ